VLMHASAVSHDRFPFLVGVYDLADKRELAHILMMDMPLLVKAYESRNRTPHPRNTNAWIIDKLPSIRLANACEGIGNTVYSLCELSAQFANLASTTAGANPQLPNTFNKLCTKVRDGVIDPSLVGGVERLEFYARVRELRTEWTHHSTVFIGGGADNAPVLVARSERRKGDRVNFPEKALFSVEQLVTWCREAIQVVDEFGLECYRRYVLPRLRMDQEIVEPERDELGFPILESDGRMLTRRVTIREYLARCGLE
jgi:hypothetical protein